MLPEHAAFRFVPFAVERRGVKGKEARCVCVYDYIQASMSLWIPTRTLAPPTTGTVGEKPLTVGTFSRVGTL